MPTRKHAVKFEAVALSAAEPGWYVLVTLPHGEHVTLNRFKTETMARDWIVDRAAGWLKRYRGGRYAEFFRESGGQRKVEEAHMTITGDQIKAARKLLGWSRTKLASRSGLTDSTLAVFEAGTRNPPLLDTSLVRSILEAAGVEFTNGDGPGARMKASIAQTADRNP